MARAGAQLRSAGGGAYRGGVISDVIAQGGLSEAKRISRIPRIAPRGISPIFRVDVADAGRRVSPELTCGG